MAETIPGGATLAADGTTWRNADGTPLNKQQIADLEQVQAERDARRDAQEQAAVALQAQRDPVARALLQQQAERAASAPKGK